MRGAAAPQALPDPPGSSRWSDPATHRFAVRAWHPARAGTTKITCSVLTGNANKKTKNLARQHRVRLSDLFYALGLNTFLN